MILDQDSAWRFINGYKKLLLEIDAVQGLDVRKDSAEKPGCKFRFDRRL
jgi:hypothetical protein